MVPTANYDPHVSLASESRTALDPTNDGNGMLLHTSLPNCIEPSLSEHVGRGGPGWPGGGGGGGGSPVRSRLRPLTSCRKETSPISRVAALRRPNAHPAAVLIRPSMPLAPLHADHYFATWGGREHRVEERAKKCATTINHFRDRINGINAFLAITGGCNWPEQPPTPSPNLCPFWEEELVYTIVP